MRTRLILSLVAGLTSAPLPAFAQHPVCKDDEAVMVCLARTLDGRTAEVSISGEDESEDLQKKATGPNVSESLAQSAIRDFLPRFAGTLLTSDPTDDLHAVDFRFNTPLFDTRGPRVSFQGGLTIHAAELYEPLVDSIPESIRAASRKRLQDELEDGDDAAAFAALNLESRRWGRAFAYHQANVDGIATQLKDVIEAQISRPEALDAFENDFVGDIGKMASINPAMQTDPRCVDSTRQLPLQGGLLLVACLTDAMKSRLNELAALVANYEAGRRIAIAGTITHSGFDRIADLVNNQPQFNVTAEYRSRLAVVGPNEWVGRARWEWGIANMNGLRSHCARMDRAHAQNSTLPRGTTVAGTVSLACLDEYAGSDETKARLARSDRFWLAAEGRYRPDYDVELEEDSVTFSLASGWGWGISGGYGRYLGSADADEKDRDRIDLHLSYDHAGGADPDGDEDDDDGLRQSRFLAGLFYTLRISGNASGIVGLSWANRSEFVGGADRQLGANLGLSYKFNGGTEGS